MPNFGRSGAGLFAAFAVLVAFVALSGYTLHNQSGIATSAPSADAARGPVTAPSRADETRANRLNQDGAELYMTRCMSCHQMNGRGVPGVFPPLSGSDWVTGDKGRLIRIVLNGMTGEMKVGDEIYSGAMPPWQTFLNDEEMAKLLTYIRQSWENDTTEVTPAEVAAVRAAVEDRKEPWTAEELAQEANQGIPGS